MAIELGANSLPQGSGLYWNGANIYCTITQGSGLPSLRMATGTDDWKKAIQFRDAKKKELAKGETHALGGTSTGHDTATATAL